MTAKKAAPVEKKGRVSAEDVAKAALDALAAPKQDFDAALDAFEEERDRKAREALAALEKKRSAKK